MECASPSDTAAPQYVRFIQQSIYNCHAIRALLRCRRPMSASPLPPAKAHVAKGGPQRGQQEKTVRCTTLSFLAMAARRAIGRFIPLFNTQPERDYSAVSAEKGRGPQQ